MGLNLQKGLSHRMSTYVCSNLAKDKTCCFSYSVNLFQMVHIGIMQEYIRLAKKLVDKSYGNRVVRGDVKLFSC